MKDKRYINEFKLKLVISYIILIITYLKSIKDSMSVL